MKNLDRGRLSVMGLVVLLLVLNTWFACRHIRQMHDDAQMVKHTQEVLEALETIVSLVKDAETGQRGYIITGEAAYLAPYNEAVATIDDQVQALAQLNIENAPGTRIDRVGPLKTASQQ
jgi:CHASE3 domain sensor protein